MVTIKSLQVKSSSFFEEHFKMEFSKKMNCVMGGRGTGKTTLLSMLYWAVNRDDALPREILSLIKANLSAGSVEIQFEDADGNIFTLTKMIGDDPAVKNAAGRLIPFDEFSKLTNFQFFSAGAIERIGLDPKQRLKLFDQYLGDEIASISADIGIAISKLKQSEIQIKSAEREIQQINEELHSFSGIEEELDKAKSALSDAKVDEAVKTEFELQDKKQANRALESNLVNRIRDANQTVAANIERLRESIEYAKGVAQTNIGTESISVKAFAKAAVENFQKVLDSSSELRKIAANLAEEYSKTIKQMKTEHEVAESEYSSLKQKIAQHREQFQKINQLTQRITARNLAAEKAKALGAGLEKMNKEREGLVSALDAAIIKRSERRRKCAEGINELLGQKVRILMKDCASGEAFEEVLRTHLARVQMRITGAERKIVEVSTPQALLAAMKSKDAETYAKTVGVLDVKRVKDLFQILGTREVLFDLESCVCDDVPNFYLGVEDENNHETFRPTEELSTGQRCTAVLPIVFAMTSGPLLIDQPEDNLDNRYITQSIHKIIRKVKEERQLLFVTHNPNIPVISDSERNAFLEFSTKKSRLLAVGDIPTVKLQIVAILEGGKDAFVKRKDIYGY